MNVFAINEIIEMGIEIERNGKEFYTALESIAVKDDVKETFKRLAAEEDKHITVFEGILKNAKTLEPKEAYGDEYFFYMKALADEYVFTKAKQGRIAASRIGSAQEALKAAIGFEKESILFYEGMKKAVPEKDAKHLNTLIAQEQSHLRQLYEMKSKSA